jgi:hypothetical protein
MNKNNTKFYFTTLLLIHILVYLLKIDKDVYAFQEYFYQPYQTYTEQPLSKNASYFVGSILGFPQSSKFCDATNICIESITVWNSISFSYNSRVHHLLKHNESFLSSPIRIITVLHRQNICHKSSEDEELKHCFFLRKRLLTI